MSKYKLIFLSVINAVLFLSIVMCSLFTTLYTAPLLILQVIIFLPLFISGWLVGYLGYIVVSIFSISVAYFSISLALWIFLLFIIPSSVAIYISKISKTNVIGKILFFISSYTAIVVMSYLSYYAYKTSINNLHYFLSDNLLYILIAANNIMGGTLEDVIIAQRIEILAFFIPSIVSFVYIICFMFNYMISKMLTKNMDDSLTVSDNLPIWHTAMFLCVALFSLLSHKMLVKDSNMHYILYNMMFILSIGYFYSGFLLIYDRIRTRGSLLMALLYVIFGIVFFVELAIVLLLIGFIREIRIASMKKFR